MSMEISIKDVEWESMSFLDKMGKVFYDEYYYYRGIYNNSRQIRRVQKLFKSGVIDSLIKESLILPIEIADISFCDSDEYAMVLRSKRIKNVLYPTEWSYSMRWDAAKLMIKMEQILLKYNYTLTDYHPYNIVFEGGAKPVHIDLGSIGIAKIDSEKIFVKSMEERYYRPLYMWRKKQRSMSEFYLTDRKVTEKEWYEYLYGVFAGDVLYKCKEAIQRGTSTNIVSLINKFNKLDDFERQTEDGHWNWSKYQNSYIDEAGGKIISSERFDIIAECLKKYNICSMTELAANQGAFSQYCIQENIVKKSLAIDYDEWAIDKLYQRIKKMDHKLPIFMGVVDLVSSSSRNYKKPSDRMRNEAVVAMALTHHLILSQGLTIEKALEIILSYGEKYVFVEFMPLGLWDIKTHCRQKKLPPEYTVDNFRDILSTKCKIKEEIFISKNRILFVGEKEIK